MLNDIFVDQLISDGRAIKISGGELATDDHYVVETLDGRGVVLARATGYDLEKVFVEAFQATPPRGHKMIDSGFCECGGKYKHVDYQENDNEATVTDSYQCDKCGTWCAITWDRETEEEIKREYEDE